MDNEFQIGFIPKENMNDILPLVQMLNNYKVPVETLKKRLQDMLLDGYQCLGAYKKEELIGICGIWVLNKLYVGKHLEPDNVFVLPEYRSAGVGKLMLDHVLNYALEIGCDATEINCYINNTKGIQFWNNQGYKTIGYHMQKVL
ncbi:Acetyltransferase (GNAT) family protein [Arenibacter palladensis]|jgi:GNAT superfamily N-acetyltransferase|uniref:Acetyltransferase (GNAT) family protein n=1 Tax=Arenibacter palladensis TaxID=237373 RepID=A0A1M4YRU0_9FLAO|nr:GNAT family N-acetyltransferase [Arenibacter palladensis]MDO6601928.1 GNAT family N-acetyltransferase [Arenibacter palladensis]SHF08026.1 Acetyltransferase (GNAT) family protein [Arenibacter palladensis]